MGRSYEGEKGPFQKLCLSGLTVDCPEEVAAAFKQVWRKMVLNKRGAFLPLKHLAKEFNALANMAEQLHGDVPTPQALLITGPKGNGKVLLYRAFADFLDEENTEPADGKLTLCLRVNLSKRKPENMGCFQQWLLRAIAIKLRTLGQHLDLAEAFFQLAQAAEGNPSTHVSTQQLSEALSSCGISEARSPEVWAALLVAREQGRLAVASALLKQERIAVILHLEEAECLFQASAFKLECAEQWSSQLMGLLSAASSAIGIVLTTSFLRAPRLFLPDGKPHLFPREFTHLCLRTKWKNAKLKHVSLVGAMWARRSLASFLLTHACKTVDPSFSLFGRVPGELPSDAALDVARALDVYVLRRCGSEGEQSDMQMLDSFLDLTLEQYGVTPRELATAAASDTFLQEPVSTLPEASGPGSGGVPSESDASLKQHSTSAALTACSSAFEAETLERLRAEIVSELQADLQAQTAVQGAGGSGGDGQAAEAEAGLSERALAAYDSLQRAHSTLKEWMTLFKGGFWIKEVSNSWGSNVLGVFPEHGERAMTVRIVRSYTILASQEVLKSGDRDGVGAAKVQEVVKGIMGVESFDEARREHLGRSHLPAVRAVGDVCIAAIAEKLSTVPSRTSPRIWKAFFDKLVMRGDVRVVDGGAMIATTHRVPDELRDYVENQLGIRILDGSNLRGHWGALQRVCDAQGVYLEAAESPP